MRRQRLETLIAKLMPAGVLGLSVALAPAAQAAPAIGAIRPDQPAQTDVATRLSSIRDAVTATMATDNAEGEPGSLLRRVWWGNHGWGRPWRWGAWRGGGWGNGGWGNGGWGNGGWGNWHPWGNGGWGNWHP